jgi:hypothetical protein
LQLRTLNQNRSAFAAVDAIESAVGADVTIGLHQFFTAPASADKP